MRIICIDDEPLILNMTVELCEKLPQGPEVVGFTKPGDALVWLNAHSADVALLDINMPGMSGLELLNAARSLGEGYGDMPVIAMTGTEDENAGDFFIDLGFDAFLEKPVKKETLFNKIYEIIDDPVFDETGYEVTDDELKKIPQGIAEIEELDVKTGMKNAGSAEDYVSAVKIFCKAIDDTANEIEKAYADGDIKTYTIKVHGLKSTARMVGAYKVSDMAAHLEEASKTVGHADLSTDTGQLLSIYRGLHEKIRHAMSECENQRDPAAKKRIDDAYATLKDYADLEDYDLIELVLGAMEHYDMPAEDEMRFKRMKDALLHFDFSAIRAVLSEVV